jgi:hypothetical protein
LITRPGAVRNDFFATTTLRISAFATLVNERCDASAEIPALRISFFIFLFNAKSDSNYIMAFSLKIQQYTDICFCVKLIHRFNQAFNEITDRFRFHRPLGTTEK